MTGQLDPLEHDAYRRLYAASDALDMVIAAVGNCRPSEEVASMLDAVARLATDAARNLRRSQEARR